MRRRSRLLQSKTNIPKGDLKERTAPTYSFSQWFEVHVIAHAAGYDCKSHLSIKVGLGSPSFLYWTDRRWKTELSKQLAIELFGPADSIICFDKEWIHGKHSVAKLVWEHLQACLAMKKQASWSNVFIVTTTILLDEVEKAHPDVKYVLTSPDDDVSTDGQGRTVSFKDTIIIMTSNAGTGKVEASWLRCCSRRSDKFAL